MHQSTLYSQTETINIIVSMGYSLALAALLCLTTWITSLHIANGEDYKCCIKNRNTRIVLQNIVDYRIQNQGLCPIASVKFLTKKNGWKCWDPEQEFAIKAIHRVNQIRLAAQEKEVTSTPAAAKDIGQTTAQLSSNNSTQIQTKEHEVNNGGGKLKRGRKRRRRNRRKMQN